MQASHSNAQKQLQRTSQNLADSITSIDTFEEQLQSAGARYTFLQETKAYIADLCDMLQVQACLAHVTALPKLMLTTRAHLCKDTGRHFSLPSTCLYRVPHPGVPVSLVMCHKPRGLT